eukprot:13574625-Alexandrium_andersonii.AAC.1
MSGNKQLTGRATGCPESGSPSEASEHSEDDAKAADGHKRCSACLGRTHKPPKLEDQTPLGCCQLLTPA